MHPAQNQGYFLGRLTDQELYGPAIKYMGLDKQLFKKVKLAGLGC